MGKYLVKMILVFAAVLTVDGASVGATSYDEYRNSENQAADSLNVGCAVEQSPSRDCSHSWRAVGNGPSYPQLCDHALRDL